MKRAALTLLILSALSIPITGFSADAPRQRPKQDIKLVPTPFLEGTEARGEAPKEGTKQVPTPTPDGTDAPGDPPKEDGVEKDAVAENMKEEEKKAGGLSDLGFAAGIGLSFHKEADIKEAEVRNGLVRVTDEAKKERALWLETHYQLVKFANNRFAFGPFLAVQVSDDDGLFDSLGAGFMVAMNRNTNPAAWSNLGFNVGVGVVSSTIRELGDGLKENQPLPDGEESIYFHKNDDIGWMVLFSFTFASGATSENATLVDGNPNTSGSYSPVK